MHFWLQQHAIKIIFNEVLEKIPEKEAVTPHQMGPMHPAFYNIIIAQILRFFHHSNIQNVLNLDVLYNASGYE